MHGSQFFDFISLDREFDANKHCGVWVEDVQKQCTRSLTCKVRFVLFTASSLPDLLLCCGCGELSFVLQTLWSIVALFGWFLISLLFYPLSPLVSEYHLERRFVNLQFRLLRSASIDTWKAVYIVKSPITITIGETCLWLIQEVYSCKTCNYNCWDLPSTDTW